MKYEDENRGEIQNRDYAKQIISFQGLKYEGAITPTDIDGLIEYHNIAFIIYEFKYCSASVPFGQYLAFKRMCDIFADAGKLAVILICQHNEEKTDKDIIAKDAVVREIYCNRKIHKKYSGKTVKEVTDRIIKKADEIEKSRHAAT